jgi:hypothetical protein
MRDKRTLSLLRPVALVRTNVLEEHNTSIIRVSRIGEVTCSSETSVITRVTWRNIPEDGILHSHCHENLKSNNETIHWLSICYKKAYGLVRREVLYSILIGLGVSMKLVRLIKMCLNETCSEGFIGTYLCDIFAIQNDLK